MSGYIGRTPLTPAVQKRESFVATAGQTSFSFTYTAGYLDVFLNGVKLTDITDFAATNGNTVVLVTGATVGDEVDMVALYNFAAIDAYSQGDSDARFEPIDSAYTKAESDAAYEPIDSAYTKSETDTRYLQPTGDGSNLTGIDALPTQSGNSGEFLTTNGTAASWATLDTDANTTTKGMYENHSVISTSYSITANNNAMSAGPITVNSGITVTVPATSTWTIL